MKNADSTHLSPRAWILVGFLAVLIPLMTVLSYKLGQLHARVESVACRAEVMECEARMTEVLVQCLRTEVQRQHGEDG